MTEINEESKQIGTGVNIKNVGISEEMHQKLERLVDDGYFSILQDPLPLKGQI